jgi:hypothetical protein
MSQLVQERSRNYLFPVEQKDVNFKGNTLIALKANNEKIYVAVKWICQGIGLTEGQYQNQTRKMNEDIVISKGIAKMQLLTNGGNQEVLCLELDYLPLWLAKINANIVAGIAQQKLVKYQLEAKDVLADAFIPKNKPQSIEDLIIMQAQSMKELKAEVHSIKQDSLSAKEEARIANARMNAWDQIDINGDKKQQLNAMVRKYAALKGITFPTAWRDFRKSYNTSYRTNLTMLLENYKLKHGLKELSYPEYLARTNGLDDALRVADKMLNQR